MARELLAALPAPVRAALADAVTGGATVALVRDARGTRAACVSRSTACAVRLAALGFQRIEGAWRWAAAAPVDVYRAPEMGAERG